MANSPKYKAIQVDQFLGLNTLDDPKSLNPSYSPYMVNMDITSTGSLQTRFGYELFSTIPAVEGGLSGILPYYRTYDDNSAVDQSQDPTHAYANTYTPPIAISETATNKCSFTPTKSGILSIAVYVVGKGTTAWTLTLHDASNNTLGTYTLLNSELTNGAFNYFYVPYTWTSGTLHFHVTSVVADGTLKCNTAGDLATASFLETYSTKGDYLLMFHKGTAYYITNDNTTPTSIGTYGTAGEDHGQVRGVVHNNVAVYSDGYSTNQGRYWNAYSQSTLASGNIYPQYFGKFNSRLFVSGNKQPSTTFFSDAGTTDTNLTSNFEEISIGDGTICTSLMDAIDKLHVLKENSIHALNFGFDASYNITPVKQTPILSSAGGAYAPGSVQPVYNYIYYLSKFGFQVYGNLEQGVQANLPLPLSFIIDNTIAQTNYLYKNEIASTFFAGRYMCAAPMGASTTNNNVFVLSEPVKRRYGVDNWVVYNGIPARQFGIFRNSDLRDVLYFASAFEPSVFKFNTTFSDNGFGYDRIWRSKTFQFGERTRFVYVDIEGSKPVNSTIYVDINTDGAEETAYEITDNNFIVRSQGGGYLGDNYLGDSYTGNGYYGADVIPMFRFRARIRFPLTVAEGYATYFQIRNNAENEGWKMTRFKLVYEMLPEDPTYFYTDTN